MAKDQNERVPDWLIPDKAYDVLKWVGLLLLPACAWFVGTIGPVWGLANVDGIVLTLNAAGALIGAAIGASALKAKVGGGDE